MPLFARTLKSTIGQDLGRLHPSRKWKRRWYLIADTAELAVWSGRRAWRATTWAVRHWLLVAQACLLAWWGVAVYAYGILLVAILTAIAVGSLLMALGSWREYDPPSFARWVTIPLRSSWRQFWVYRREWQPALVGASLTRQVGTTQHLPVLRSVRSGEHFDTLTVRMLTGHTIDTWSAAGEQLAHVFNVEAIRAYPVPDDTRLVRLECRVRDPLRDEVPAITPGRTVDLSAVHVGMREDGEPLTLPVAGAHLLMGGETGAGKSSALWALLAGLAPGIRDGYVQVVAIDPKGMELAAGQPLFRRYCRDGTPEEAVRHLEHTVSWMRSRQKQLHGQSRDHTPSTEMPQVVVIVDELAAITSWVGDSKLRGRLAIATKLIQSQGRAAGFTLVGASQIVQKETLGANRELSTHRVSLRAPEAGQVDMLLGQGARARGAWSDRINPATRGVCYLVQDGKPEPVRARFAHVTDADIRKLVTRYGQMKTPEAIAA